jgi:hypothetical protein
MLSQRPRLRLAKLTSAMAGLIFDLVGRLIRTRKVAIIGQRILFAGVLFFLAPAVIRLIKGPVTMFTDFPTTASLIVCAFFGIFLSWWHCKRMGIWIFVCDILLILLVFLDFR